MRVALVQCPPWGSLPPLGLASLKAYVEQRGHEVRCVDLNIEYCRERQRELIDDVGGTVYARPDPWLASEWSEWDFEFDGREVRFRGALADRPLPVERWVDAVLGTAPELVGFSVQATNLGVTLQVAQEIARRDPSMTIVFGGPNVTRAQQGDMALRTGVPDAVVEGEGEETLVELLARLHEGRSIDDVRGIGRLVDGEPRWNEPRELIRDIDSLPFPDFTDFDWAAYPNPYEIPIMASRGCVLKCAFCYETVYWKRYRTQSPRRVVAEIRHQLAIHPMRSDVESGRVRFGMSFADSLVNGHLGGLKRMAEMLVEADVGIYWNGQATINTRMDEEYFALLARSGCTGLSFGLESGSPRVLESMGKRFSIDEAGAFFRRAHRSGIELIVNVMVGYPTETRADFVETMRFLARVRRDIDLVNNVGATAVVGGSRLQLDPERYGIEPADPAGWATGRDLRWRSRAAGSERGRQRRVRILHAWMTLVRIPHQATRPMAERRLARWWRALRRRPNRSDPVTTTRRAPAASPPVTMADAVRRRRIAKLAKGRGVQPLVVPAPGGTVGGPMAVPTWAEPLSPETWIGVELDELGPVVSAALGDGVAYVDQVAPDGVVAVEVVVEHPAVDGLSGLDLWVFPGPGGDDGRVMVAFPRDGAPRQPDP